MSRDPGSRWAPLPEAGSQGSYAKTQFVVHSTGSRASAAANRRYFSEDSVKVESTFIVGLSPTDPTLQLLDSTARADANGEANKTAISVEVVGEGGDPFTSWQLAELIRLGSWAHYEHRIDLRIIPTPDRSGYGWHVMFGAPGPWTSVRGKVCPGKTRISQLRIAVFPVVFLGGQVARLGPSAASPPPLEEDDEMSARLHLLKGPLTPDIYQLDLVTGRRRAVSYAEMMARQRIGEWVEPTVIDQPIFDSLLKGDLDLEDRPTG